VDGNDVVAVRAAALAAVGRIRDGSGPFLVECKTTRIRGHFEGDPQKYRDATEVEAAGLRDPIKQVAEKLRDMGVSEADITAAADTAARRVDEAVAIGRAGTSPIASEALADVYSKVAEARP
jgi:pyruvate dehydrogenase E1 component alpha subunit